MQSTTSADAWRSNGGSSVGGDRRSLKISSSVDVNAVTRVGGTPVAMDSRSFRLIDPLQNDDGDVILGPLATRELANCEVNRVQDLRSGSALVFSAHFQNTVESEEFACRRSSFERRS